MGKWFGALALILGMGLTIYHQHQKLEQQAETIQTLQADLQAMDKLSDDLSKIDRDARDLSKRVDDAQTGQEALDAIWEALP